MKKHYRKEIELYHYEVPAALDKASGEVREIKDHVNRNPTIHYHNSSESFQKTFTKAWRLLETQTTDKEFAVANKLAYRAKAFTNSLRPLNDDSTIMEIANELNSDRRTIMKVIDKLFKLGVIGKFEVYNANVEYTKYWIFNPYLSFNGKVIDEGIAKLFSGTTYAKLG